MAIAPVCTVGVAVGVVGAALVGVGVGSGPALTSRKSRTALPSCGSCTMHLLLFGSRLCSEPCGTGVTLSGWGCSPLEEGDWLLQFRTPCRRSCHPLLGRSRLPRHSA